MKILVMNCGSSSLKYQLIDMENENVLAKGLCERIGIEGSKIKHEGNGKFETEKPMHDHTEAIKMVIDALLDPNHGVIKSIDEVNAVGHRVVHGGEYFSNSVIITEEVKKAIEACNDLAPLHNPPNLMGIYACENLMPGKPQIAVFDTAFHQTMPEKAYLYAIPYELYEKYKIRRYGFHGTSHKYVSDRAAALLGKDKKDLKIVTCHLGNGASVCAVKNGESVDTSMGFTPLEGLIMGTRSGDIDPAVISFLMDKEELKVKDVENILNKKSGVLGLSGVSSDFRDIEGACSEGNKRAEAALQAYYYRVAKYVGEYAAAMNGVDAIVFTAGLGENSADTREAICSYLGYLGVNIDKEKNNCRGKEVNFAAEGSKVDVLVIPTNEELVIARDTKELLDK
ncbi:acetate/propionate family kinase [Anaeropeptidivorans aminofermentans]|jgi:acetate kinase|uniref:acetate/propionate family kinase n=1 Tax=Anaeropeptidivorans aminofermentans TaxID=2934315 RepID=UPI002023F192|nr:acetate kinase [Anaeropeptidivorans aminofermentans]MBE6011238.1 acetate kinase [Lachnospiraceae bacterium]